MRNSNFGFRVYGRGKGGGVKVAKTIEDVYALAREIAGLLEKTDAAERLIEDARFRVKKAEALRPAAPGPTIYFEIWPKPLRAAGPGSLPGHLLERAGKYYPTREIVSRRPDKSLQRTNYAEVRRRARQLAQAKINIEYAYGTAGKDSRGALILRVSDTKKAKKLLKLT